MTNKNATINKELVNKLSNIIREYDPYTAYIDDYKQYSNAVDTNCELDQQFIHTCKEYGYDVGVSFCYSLAKSLASGKFDSAEETVIDYINSLTKEDDSILSSPNTTPENNDNANNKEEIAMKKNTNINNATTEVKEESTMTNIEKALINDYVKAVKEGNNSEAMKIVDEFNATAVKEETTMKKTEAIPATHQVICIDHAYYDDEYIAFTGTQEECNDYIERHFTEEDARLGLCSYTIHPVPAVTKVNNPAPDDAKVLTYRLMHKIGDHALSNRKKGFGTTISAWMLCAYILKVKYGMTHLKGHEHEVTDEMKETVKDVRNWLLNNGYIKPVTFKDEKGFTFYTPEYDGNRKDKMYDCTKFRATGKVETTTYMVTKKMNKWYV